MFYQKNSSSFICLYRFYSPAQSVGRVYPQRPYGQAVVTGVFPSPLRPGACLPLLPRIGFCIPICELFYYRRCSLNSLWLTLPCFPARQFPHKKKTTAVRTRTSMQSARLEPGTLMLTGTRFTYNTTPLGTPNTLRYFLTFSTLLFLKVFG